MSVDEVEEAGLTLHLQQDGSKEVKLSKIQAEMRSDSDQISKRRILHLKDQIRKLGLFEHTVHLTVLH